MGMPTDAHSAGFGMRFENIYRVAFQKEVIGGVYSGRAGSDYRDLEIGGFLVLDQILIEPLVRDVLLPFGYESLEELDSDRLVDEISPACKLAETNAYAAAGFGHRVLLEDYADRVGQFTVLDVIDVARNFNLGRTGFDTGRGHVGVGRLLFVVGYISYFRFELMPEIGQHLLKRHCSGLS